MYCVKMEIVTEKIECVTSFHLKTVDSCLICRPTLNSSVSIATTASDTCMFLPLSFDLVLEGQMAMNHTEWISM